MVEVNRAFLRSVRGGLKMARMALAFMATVTFGVGQSHEAYLTLGIIELVITFLFFLLYLLHLQRALSFLFWPLADAFNSLVAALFLFIAGLCGTVKKNIPEDLIGGVFFLILCALCIADAVFLLKNITFNRPPTSRDIIHR
ncbi:chemokine-like factor [Anolis carolinensis]|uniref:Chemokine like factor n=1 Tax=Anolis carolinensis TaxID=28377 RepID=R4GAL7_ANOCA|nr:PREDICTED: chemokine-like factor [Anolis carolinensis]|eukprot:XP_008115859.1 PREDICTED: chemokine-like factor [Anolis carolinensis]